MSMYTLIYNIYILPANTRHSMNLTRPSVTNKQPTLVDFSPQQKPSTSQLLGFYCTSCINMWTFLQEGTTHWIWCTTSPLPQLGLTDHITIMLRRAHRPRVRIIRPTQKQVHVWTEGASSALMDCFSTTDL